MKASNKTLTLGLPKRSEMKSYWGVGEKEEMIDDSAISDSDV